MATGDELLSIVGMPIKSASFRTLVATDRLKAHKQEDLEEGEPVETYFVGKKMGYEILTHSGRVVSVFLYAEPTDGYTAFPGPYPCGVDHGSTRAKVRQLLGKPERSGKAFKDRILGQQGAWDRFAVGTIRIHFQYTNPGLRVSLITMMTETDAP
jgi:hypothetical protein